MTRFASRELSFVSLSEMGDQPGHTQECAAPDGVTACTCCTDNTSKKARLAFDADLPALREQLSAARS